MQAGHYAVALTIASFAPELTGGAVDAFSAEAMIVTLLATQLPNLDGIPIMLGWAPKAFHCTYSHSLLFPLVVGLLLLPFSIPWAILTVVSVYIHYLCDMPSSVGLPLLLPFSKKRYTFNLWADTGYFGWISFKGTYEQAWTWILEGGSFFILLIRCYQEGVWPF